jgi:tRNA(fMet)-specific endonuclease VapC
MLDTNTLIYIVKKRPLQVLDRLNSLNDDDELCMSFVSYAELQKGAEQSSKPQAAAKANAMLINEIPVIFNTNEETCFRYAAEFLRLKRLGTPIGGNDLWIACHALSISAVLVTNNTREFARIQGLALDNWVV